MYTKNVYIQMFIATLFVTAETWTAQIPINRILVVYPYNGILLGDKNEWTPHKTTWMNPRIFILSEISQTPPSCLHFTM